MLQKFRPNRTRRVYFEMPDRMFVMRHFSDFYAAFVVDKTEGRRRGGGVKSFDASKCLESILLCNAARR